MELSLLNLDLLTVGIAITSIVVLGFSVYFNDSKSKTASTFLFLALFVALWSTVNYLSYQPFSPLIGIWLIRTELFFAVWFCFFLFQFSFIFPKTEHKFSKVHTLLFTPLISFISFLTLTPFVVKEISALSEDGRITDFVPGEGILAFGLTVSGLLIMAAIAFFRKIQKVEASERAPYRIVLGGMLLTLTLLLVFAFVFPALLNNSAFIPLGAIFMFPLIGFTYYAIQKHKLFNLKVLSAGLFTGILALVTFLEVIFSSELEQILFRSSVFILVLVFGILLLKTIFREVEQRQEIELLASDLKKANEKLKELDALKSKFMSMASHDLRSPLGAIKGYASMLTEGSFGKLGSGADEAVRRIFKVSEQMNGIIEDFLNVSRIEQGGLKYDYEKANLTELVKEIFSEQEPAAKSKGLDFTFKTDKENYLVNIDVGKIKQIVTNLIDNSVKYTQKGSIAISIKSLGSDFVLVSVSDTGIGMTKYESTQLFKKFSRLQGGRDVNKKGTGLGLYIAKQMIQAHKGDIGVSSKGKGLGSTFWIKLPICSES